MSEVNEPVQVAMIFRGNEICPQAFLWHGHRYVVHRTTIMHKTHLGDALQWHFTVETINGGTARLAFDTLSLSWQLEAIDSG